MNAEKVDQLLEMCRELRRQALEEGHAREMQILEATETLISLIPIHIDGMRRRLRVLLKTLEAAQSIERILKPTEGDGKGN